MRNLRKALVMVMAMVMALMTSLTAFAAGTTTDGYENKDVKVTISSDDLIKGHKFVAYQIFKGTQEDGKGDPSVVPGNHLGNVEWGSGIDLNATSQVKIVGSDGKEQEVTKTFLEELKELVLDGKNGADGTTPFADIIELDTEKPAYAENALRVSEKIESLWKADGYKGTVNTSDENAYEYSPEFQRFMDDFARIAARYVKNGKELQTLGDTTNEKTFYLPSGYYLIVDETSEADLTNKDGEIVGVTNVAVFQPTLNIEIRLKTDKPSLDKHIEVDKNVTTVDREDNEVVETQKETTDYNNAAIGDTVNFLVTSEVPDMTHYHTYKFVVNDLLSEGFDYKKDSVEIKVGEITLKGDEFDVITVNAEGYQKLSNDKKALYGLTDNTFTGDYARGTYIRIIFKDFYEKYLEHKGEAIEVRYSATVNERAKIGDTGNPNEAKLQYWRNPDIREEGIPNDDFKPDEPKGETPWEVTLTYITALKLTKIDGENPERADAGLAGAEFSITGEKLNRAKTVGYVYQKVEKGATGTYYKLKDGTYTTTAPTDDTMDLYESSDMYEKVEIKNEVTECEEVNFGIEVDGNGVLSLTGLSEGEYIFKEIKAPYGYNLLKDPIKVIITWEAPEKAEGEDSAPTDACTWTAKYGWWKEDPTREGEHLFDPIGILTFNAEDGIVGGFAFDVANYTGALLPRTGGIGTTIFYVVGCALVVVAGVLLVLKRRANAKED